MQVVITQISACYEIVDQNGGYNYIGKKRLQRSCSSHSVFKENRLERSYPREPSSPIPGSLLHIVTEHRRNAELMSITSFHD